MKVVKSRTKDKKKQMRQTVGDMAGGRHLGHQRRTKDKKQMRQEKNRQGKKRR